LRGINDNMSFTVIFFFHLNVHRIFFITPRMAFTVLIFMKFETIQYIVVGIPAIVDSIQFR